MEMDRSLLGESRTSFLSHRECIEEEYEYANKFRKQGRKNPKNIPKFTINPHRFCYAIEKISETYAHASDTTHVYKFDISSAPRVCTLVLFMLFGF